MRAGNPKPGYRRAEQLLRWWIAPVDAAQQAELYPRIAGGTLGAYWGERPHDGPYRHRTRLEATRCDH